MKKFFVYFFVTLFVVLAFLFGKFSQKDIGRYQIIMHPTFRADEYLLDTQTGRTWQITEESKEKYLFWHENPRDELPLSSERE